MERQRFPRDDRRIRELDADLERQFADRLVLCPTLDRKTVSFQGNKQQPKYRWFKYKEGFSSVLVRFLISEYFDALPKRILDPFAGSGTTLLTACELGIDADGIELLPIAREIIEVRSRVESGLTSEEIDRLQFWQTVKPWQSISLRQPLHYLKTTDGAYSPETEAAIERYLFAMTSERDRVAKLLRFVLLCILESVSFTRKDGQYLRWDYRAQRQRRTGKFNKGKILDLDGAIVSKLAQILEDIELELFNASRISSVPNGKITLFPGSCLDILPTLADKSYDAIITSPPYCNRYDYTRTYALELALLGVTETEMRQLRQAMLSCTVENKEKTLLQNWKSAIAAADSQVLLQAILEDLEAQKQAKRLNNSGIPRMVKGYFYEMAAVIFESARVLQPGGLMFVVNDNVRYAGVDISVDTILSDLARHLGFAIVSILVLPASKGNSSQQMGQHGRKPLRKCVYIWRKR